MPSGRSKKTDGLKLNGMHELLLYVDANLFDENVNFMKT
jgi:hypothetical protein